MAHGTSGEPSREWWGGRGEGMRVYAPQESTTRIKHGGRG